MPGVRDVSEHRALHRFTLEDDTCLEIPSCLCQPYMRTARSVDVHTVRLETPPDPAGADAHLEETDADLVYYGQVVRADADGSAVVSADGLLLQLRTQAANLDAVRVDVTFS